jgi:lysophospholipase L1-like esterase
MANPSVPQWIRPDWRTERFVHSVAGVPTLARASAVLVTSQPQLDSLVSAAAADGVKLEFSSTNPTPGGVAPPSKLPAVIDDSAPSVDRVFSSSKVAAGYAPTDYPTPYASPLYGAHAALGWRESQQAKVCLSGHSVGAGTGATIVSNRWFDKLMAFLRSGYPVIGAPGGLGSPDGTHNTSGYTPIVVHNGDGSVNRSNYSVVSGTAPTVGTDAALGADGEYVSVPSGTTISFAFIGTSVGLRVGRWAGQSSTMTVTQDGVAGLATTYTNGTGSNTSGEVYNTPDLPFGLHTVTIASSGANALRLEGYHVFGGDRTKGIHGINASHSGWTSTQIVANMATRLQPFWTKAYTPNLFLFMGMINDYNLGVPSATTAANIQMWINAALAVNAGFHAPGILILAEWQIGNPAAPVEPWSNYVAAAKATAAANGAMFLDLGARIPSPGTDNTFGLFQSDLIHPTDKGHEMVAEIVFEAITRGRGHADLRAGARRRTLVISANYTATTDDDLIVTSTSGITVTLPAATGLAGWGVTVRNASTGSISVAATVEGSATPTLAAGTTGRYRSDGVAWWSA